MTNTKILVILLSFIVKNYLPAMERLFIPSRPSTAFLIVPANPFILLSAMEQMPRRTPSAKGTAKIRSS